MQPAVLSSLLPQAARWACLACNVGAQRAFGSAAAALPSRQSGNVPPGHINSDLRPTVCHIGLGRRRDLTLRQDLCLYLDGEKKTLGDVFLGRKCIVVGFPGGRVCTEKHIPGYVEMTEALERKGVDQVVCITPGSPEGLKQLLQEKPHLTSSKVKLAADPGCGFIRLLGLELGVGKDTGPQCQRFAAIVENGVLLKVKVESDPASLTQTDAHSMCRLWQEVYDTGMPQ